MYMILIVERGGLLIQKAVLDAIYMVLKKRYRPLFCDYLFHEYPQNSHTRMYNMYSGSEKEK